MFSRKQQIAIVAGLLGLSCLVQVVLIRRAKVPALDAVRFVESARNIGRQGVPAALQSDGEQPLFACSVWLTHEALERTIGPGRSTWALSAQVAAAIPLILAVVPVYFLAVRLAGRAAGLAGSLLFCFLPEVSRLGADGISDSTHLLFFCVALWAVVRYLQEQSGERKAESGEASWRAVSASRFRLSAFGFPLFLAGSAIAAAMLARAEVVVLPAALVATLVVFQFQRRRRQTWAALAAAIGCLGLGFGVLFGPYLIASGALTPQAALGRALGTYRPPEPAAAPEPAAWQLADGREMSFDRKEPTVSLRRRGWVAAAELFAEELADAYGYWIGPFALLGLWRQRRALGRRESRFLQVFFLLYSVAVFRFAAVEGYLSARHLLMLVVPGVGCAGCGLLGLSSLRIRRLFGANTSRYLKSWVPWRWLEWACSRVGANMPTLRDGMPPDSLRDGVAPDDYLQARVFGGTSRSRLGWMMVSLAVLGCVLDSARPLHAGKTGHRRAGRWLALEAPAPGVVLDTRGWTGLYSGRSTYGYEEARQAFSDPGLAYVVLERRELGFESDRSRTLRSLLATAAEPVVVFPDPVTAPAGSRSVLVYRWSPERFSH